MSFGTEFEERCLRFEQASNRTHLRGVSFVKMYAFDKKIGMALTVRTDDNSPLNGQTLVECLLDGTIRIYWRSFCANLQRSVQADILTRIEAVAILASEDREKNTRLYRRRAGTETVCGDTFMDFLEARHGGFNAKAKPGPSIQSSF